VIVKDKIILYWHLKIVVLFLDSCAVSRTEDLRGWFIDSSAIKGYISASMCLHGYLIEKHFLLVKKKNLLAMLMNLTEKYKYNLSHASKLFGEGLSIN
jgi:hypothetical protein